MVSGRYGCNGIGRDKIVVLLFNGMDLEEMKNSDLLHPLYILRYSGLSLTSQLYGRSLESLERRAAEIRPGSLMLPRLLGRYMIGAGEVIFAASGIQPIARVTHRHL